MKIKRRVAIGMYHLPVLFLTFHPYILAFIIKLSLLEENVKSGRIQGLNWKLNNNRGFKIEIVCKYWIDK